METTLCIQSSYQETMIHKHQEGKVYTEDFRGIELNLYKQLHYLTRQVQALLQTRSEQKL